MQPPAERRHPQCTWWGKRTKYTPASGQYYSGNTVTITDSQNHPFLVRVPVSISELRATNVYADLKSASGYWRGGLYGVTDFYCKPYFSEWWWASNTLSHHRQLTVAAELWNGWWCEPASFCCVTIISVTAVIMHYILPVCLHLGSLCIPISFALRTKRLGRRGHSKYHNYGICVKPG